MHSDQELNDEVGILKRREIEARLLRPLIEVIQRQFGTERMLELLHEVVDDAAARGGAEMRKRAEDALGSVRNETPDLVAFSEQWGPWFKDGALEIEELKKESDEWSFKVTRCRYAEMYRELGMESLGAHLSCRRDARLLTGYNNDYILERRQTIMEGAAFCDFHYRRRTRLDLEPNADQEAL